MRRREQTEYRIKVTPDGLRPHIHYVERRVGETWSLATDWMFLNWERAQAYIDRQLLREYEYNTEVR